MTTAQQQQAARNFAAYWKDKGYEKGESQPFWLSLLRDVYGVEHPEQFIQFEEQVHLDHTSFIDGTIPATHVLIEQKGLGKDLNKPIKQSDGALLNPFEQAKRYILELPVSQHPRWVVTCNFSTFYVYDMERPRGEAEIIELANLEKEYYRLQFLVDAGNEHLKREMEVSIAAGEIVGLLYDAFYKQYANPESEHVGYKYYETRYEDCILGQGNADGTAGTYASTGAWNYNEEVSYPFGYGLSYTTFDQTLDGVTYNSDTDNYEVKVTVTNNGTVSGKSVVQVYAQTPYGDYEKQNAVEKASVQLAGFAKTGELAPGASETVTVEVQKYFLASYDSKGAKGYILSAGDYYLAVGDDAHDAVNNILAAKGAANMTDVLGNPAAGNASKVYTWNEKQLDTTTYANSRVNADVKVTNQFDDADLNSWLADTVTYLSRSDWEGTYPVNYSEVVLNVTEEMIKKLADFYEKPADSPAVSDFIQGEDSGITFIQMKDVDYDDDEIWDAFLNQFTTDELLSLLNAGTEEIARLGIPAGKQVDDNIEIMSSFVASPDQTGGQYWVCEVVTSSTFNTERFAERGRLIGLEVEFCGYNESWYGGGNLHRIPFGGRNQQYYSEDGVLGYYVGAEEAKAMQDVGVAYSIKHFAGNNQETDRESVSSFFTEQAFREEELRAFEGAFTEGGCLSVMTAFNRLGLTYCGYSSALNQNVLRDEWGFKGHNTTDAIAGSLYKQNWGTSLAAGTDYYCFNAFLPMMGVVDALEGVGTLINNGDGYILQNLRRAVKNTIYTWLHSVSVNGLSSTSVIVTITPWWKPALTGVIAVLGVVSALLVVAYILSSRKKKEAA